MPEPKPPVFGGDDFESHMTPEQQLSSSLREQGLAEEFEAAPHITPERQKEILDDLDRVAELMNDADIDWWLAGGLSLDLVPSGMTRDHQDLDIEIDPKKAKQFLNFAVSNDYRLYTGHGESIKDIDNVLEEHSEIFLRKYKKGKVEPFVFEVMVVPKNEDESIRFKRDSSLSFPSELYESPKIFTLPTGKEVCLTPRSVQVLYKLYSGRQSDYYDIKRVLPTLDDNERSQLHGYLDVLKPVFDVRGEKAHSLDELFDLVEKHKVAEKKDSIDKHIREFQDDFNKKVLGIYRLSDKVPNRQSFFHEVERYLDMPIPPVFNTQFYTLADALYGEKKVSEGEFISLTHTLFDMDARGRSSLRLNVSRMDRWTVDGQPQ